MAINGLFPPMIDAYLPALPIHNAITNGAGMGIPINFTISSFNNLSDIKGIHISITRQSNYNSLLDSSLYPMGIYVAQVNSSKVSINGYSGTITVGADIINKLELNYNEYYKVQLRFSKDENYSDITGRTLTEYLVNESNLEMFSEWSTVGLIRFIATPLITMSANGTEIEPSPAVNNSYVSNIVLNGVYDKTLSSNDKAALSGNDKARNAKNDLEYIASYKITIQKWTNVGTPRWINVFESGQIDTDSLNNQTFYYEIPYYFNDYDASGGEGGHRQIVLEYTTANLYQGTERYIVKTEYTKDSWSGQSIVSESLSIDSVIGKMNISISPTDDQVPIPEGSKFVIRRASDKDNFQYWDTIWEKTLTAAESNTISYNDFTVESGYLYKYEINYIDSTNTHHYFIVEGPVITVFNDAFLTGEGTQLCVKFNSNISNFKRNVSDNIVTTLGGKYPYVNRNGSMNYRSFSLTGTIAYEMDAEHQFATRNSIYGSNNIEIYGSYFVNRYINAQNDRITQRRFRELVMDYLYSDIPKLFRSSTEGNILVRLTDINFTPNQQLGRMLYDFNCTATEIGEATIENCKLYGIQDFGDA